MKTPDESVAFSATPATRESESSATIQLNLGLPFGTSIHPLSERFYRVLGGLALLHLQKQLDYGATDDPFANVRSSRDFGIKPWVGALVRGNDKMKRIQKFAREGSLANESVIDSLRDLAVYAVIGLVLYEEGEGLLPEEVTNEQPTEPGQE